MLWILTLFGFLIGGLLFNEIGALICANLGFGIGLLVNLKNQHKTIALQNAKIQAISDQLKKIEQDFTTAAADKINQLPTSEEITNTAQPVAPPVSDASLMGQSALSPSQPSVAASVSLPLPAAAGSTAKITGTINPASADPRSEGQVATDVHSPIQPSATRSPKHAILPPLPAAAPRDTHKAPPTPGLIEKGFAAAKAWLLGGNPVLRIGAVILFLGLAFLLRFTAEQFTFPVEARYIAVALSAIVLLSLGWLLRKRNTHYALILQGTGIAVLYLTIFAALRLHPLISSGMAFGLLAFITAFLAILAVQQNSLPLATAAVLGGFAAPILTSTGEGNHVALFSYFILLNTAILAIAWFKAWRLLNLVGFIGTFGIGLAWGLRAYTPEKFSSTEPFLLLFFVMYVLIGLLFTWRKLRDDSSAPQTRSDVLPWSRKQGDYLDATTIFGPPIVGFGLQVAVVQHIELATAFSALLLGFVYMLLAYGVRARAGQKALLLFETYLALGVIFASLSIPLGLDARWTSAAWAVEGAGLLWLGLRQQRPMARLFALLLQGCAALAYLSQIRPGTSTLLEGSALGAIMLGAALLFSFWQIRRTPAAASTQEHLLQPWLGLAGLAFLYLTAPLLFSASYVAMAWAIAGVITLFVAVRIASVHFLVMAFVIQLLAGLLFLVQQPLNDFYAVVGNASSWLALTVAALVGACLIANVILAMRAPFTQTNKALLASLSGMLIVGLVFLNLSVKFVLPWLACAAVWGFSGVVVLWLSLQLRKQAALWFSLVLQCFAGLVVMNFIPSSLYLSSETLTPLAHMDFWAPIILSLAALLGAWRLHTHAPNPAVAHPFPNLQPLSVILLVASVGWLGLAWVMEIVRFVPQPLQTFALLLLGAFSALAWMVLALRYRWMALATVCSLLALYGAIVLLQAWPPTYNPLAHWGWLGWPVLLIAHYTALRKLATTASTAVIHAAHVMGCWLTLAVLGCSVHDALLNLSEHYNAWRWLGWALLPTLYLWAMALPRPWVWPINAYPFIYRFVAAAPLAAGMLVWFWMANALSAGNSEPLPYIPLINPLELGLGLCLGALWIWSRSALELHPRVRHLGLLRQYVAGLSVLALLTAIVMRTAHQWADIPWSTAALLQSMLVQASLSILWTLCAICLMIFGHRRGLRKLWVTGAALIAIVVFKLFFVELSNSGGLERIVSFIAVGVLLLIVGYFAPLPPRQNSASTAPSPSPEVDA